MQYGELTLQNVLDGATDSKNSDTFEYFSLLILTSEDGSRKPTQSTNKSDNPETRTVVFQ
jgi:hypothetical protein